MKLTYPSAELKAEIVELSLPTRAFNALMRGLHTGEIKAITIADLRDLNERDLLKARNMGRVSARHIREALKGVKSP
jgi:DNA-directed RNA polymerase alpha subunit